MVPREMDRGIDIDGRRVQSRMDASVPQARDHRDPNINPARRRSRRIQIEWVNESANQPPHHLTTTTPPNPTPIPAPISSNQDEDDQGGGPNGGRMAGNV